MAIRMARWVGAALLALIGTAGAHAEDIKVGFNGDISASPTAQSGRAGVIGIETAIADINASGGVLGRNLALVVRDDQSQPQKAIQNMSDLIDNEHVAAVFGPVNASSALAWKPLVTQKKVVVMDMIAAATDVTKPLKPGADNYIFRVSMVDRDQVAALGAYAKRKGAKRIGLMGETTGYGQGGLRDMQDIAKLQGLDVAAVESFAVSDTDMTSQLSKMRSANVDLLMVWAQGTPMGSLFRSMAKIDYYPPTLTSWAADNITFFDAAGKDLAEQPIFMRTLSDKLTSKQKALFDRVGSRLAAPSAFPFAVHGYDATLLLAAAIKQAGSTDGPKLREALENLATPVAGLLKTYDKPFSADAHEAIRAKDMVFIRWKAGELVPYSDDITKALSDDDFMK